MTIKFGEAIEWPDLVAPARAEITSLVDRDLGFGASTDRADQERSYFLRNWDLTGPDAADSEYIDGVAQAVAEELTLLLRSKGITHWTGQEDDVPQYLGVDAVQHAVYKRALEVLN